MLHYHRVWHVGIIFNLCPAIRRTDPQSMMMMRAMKTTETQSFRLGIATMLAQLQRSPSRVKRRARTNLNNSQRSPTPRRRTTRVKNRRKRKRKKSVTTCMPSPRNNNQLATRYSRSPTLQSSRPHRLTTVPLAFI